MILSKVTFDSNNRYEPTYFCHSCGKHIQDNRFEYCPSCGVKFIKIGRPEKLELDVGDICGIIAFAIQMGGFNETWTQFRNDGKYYKVERPGNMGMVWAAWKKETQEKKQIERENKCNGGDCERHRLGAEPCALCPFCDEEGNI